VDAAMSSDAATLVTLAIHFAILSLFAMGGANAAVPEMHRLAVDVMRWMNDRQFADMFALAQVAPGPNVIIVTLIGYHVAGLPGAAVTTSAMCGPSCVFAFFMGRVWQRFKDAPWRVAIQAGLVPIAVGLVGASAVILARAADQNWVAMLITAVTAFAAYVTRWNPLWMFGAAALLGVAGLV
jgi:chromate transporter